MPSHCGTRELFDASIRARVGDEEGRSILDALTLRIREQQGTYTLAMQVGRETRYLRDHDCGELFRAAVVVAIALWEAPANSEAVIALPPSEASGGPGTLGSASARSMQSAPVTASISGPFGRVWLERAARSRHELQLGTEIGVVAGLQPKPSPFVGIRGALDHERFGIDCSIRWAPARSDRDANNRGVEVTAIGARVAGYYRLSAFIGLELGARAHVLKGTGLGSTQNRSADLWTFGPVLGLWATPLSIGGAFVMLGAEGHLALVRPSFEIAEYGRVFRVPPLGGSTFLVAGYRFE